MQKPQIVELEKEFSAYKFKCLAQKCLVVLVFLLCLSGVIVGVLAYKDKQNTLKMAIDEKNKMSQKLEHAKVQIQKAQILSQKRQNLTPPNTPPKPTQKPKDKIIIHSYVANTQKLEEEFSQKAEYKAALKIANLHLAQKDYEKALLWSLKANEIDKNEAGAWVSFAKAKFALGKKDEAKQALQSFLRFYSADISALEEVKYILK